MPQVLFDATEGHVLCEMPDAEPPLPQRAWTPEELHEECVRLATAFGEDGYVSLVLSSRPDLNCVGLLMYPTGMLAGHVLHVTSTTFGHLFAEAERHIADYHAHSADAARKRLAEAQAEVDALEKGGAS